MTDAHGRNLEYVEKSGKKGSEKWKFRWNHGNETHTFVCEDRANPELIEAFASLHDAAMIGSPHLDVQFQKQTVVSALECDWKAAKKRKNVVLYFDTKLTTEYVPGRTQKMLADGEQEEKKKGRWPDHCIAIFNKVELASFSYIDGNRSQQELPLIENDGKQSKLDLDKELSDKTSDIVSHMQKNLKNKDAA